jgi:hypothetical protein
LIRLNAGASWRGEDGQIVHESLEEAAMQRRTFLTLTATAGLAIALGATEALAQGMGGMSATERDKMREQMRKRWDEMDHEGRSQAMEGMRGRRHEPKYEEMRERWDKMSPADRQKMLERHERRHGEGRKG